MRTLKKIFILCLFITLSIVMNAQPAANSNSSNDFINTMNSSGKIYVVVAVLAVILVGIFGFLISIDRKPNFCEARNYAE